MRDNTTPIETLFEKAEDYGKTTIELFKLNTIDKSAEIISSLTARIAIFLVVVLFVFTINIGIALWIGELLGKFYYGFFVMGVFYLIIAFLLYAFSDQWIKRPISNSVIAQLLKEKNNTN